MEDCTSNVRKALVLNDSKTEVMVKSKQSQTNEAAHVINVDDSCINLEPKAKFTRCQLDYALSVEAKDKRKRVMKAIVVEW